MEQHPVPQDISGFEFKLIGDITLKQFAYLAAGLIIAYIATKLTLIPYIFRWPLAGFSALFGIGLAFVPIEERPMDRWVTSFIKSIYAPTQFVWKKQNAPPEVLMSSTPVTPPIMITAPVVSAIPKPIPAAAKAQEFIATLPLKPISKPVPLNTSSTTTQYPRPPLPKAAHEPESWTLGKAPVTAKPASVPPAAPGSTIPITGKRIVFEEKEIEKTTIPTTPNPEEVTKIKTEYQAEDHKLNEQIEALKKELQQGTLAKERFIELQQTFAHLIEEKDRLNAELNKLRKQFTESEKQGRIETPRVTTTTPDDTKTTVKIVSSTSAVRAGIPSLTSQPNVITGIIKDSQGNLLPNLIVTVKDKDKIPVRALKSNKLGQFAASTPLGHGMYIIEVEDPKKKYQFNLIGVNLSGKILPPLEISAISEKDVLRQKLTRDIFGKDAM